MKWEAYRGRDIRFLSRNSTFRHALDWAEEMKQRGGYRRNVRRAHLLCRRSGTKKLLDAGIVQIATNTNLPYIPLQTPMTVSTVPTLPLPARRGLPPAAVHDASLPMPVMVCLCVLCATKSRVKDQDPEFGQAISSDKPEELCQHSPSAFLE